MNLSKADKRNLELLVTHFNFRVDDVEGLTSLFNNAFGGFLRSSSGPAVRAKRAKALLATFPNLNDVALNVMEKARASTRTVGSMNWPKVS